MFELELAGVGTQEGWHDVSHRLSRSWLPAGIR